MDAGAPENAIVETFGFRVKGTAYSRKVRNVMFAIASKYDIPAEEVLATAGKLNAAIYRKVNEYLQMHFRTLKALRWIKLADRENIFEDEDSADEFKTEFDDEVEMIGEETKLTKDIAIQILRKIRITVNGEVEVKDGKLLIRKAHMRIYHVCYDGDIEVAEEHDEKIASEIEETQE